MTKTEEIALLRKTAKALGHDSYSGALLALLIPQIEADMAADQMPQFDLRAAQVECRQRLAQCEADCAALKAAAAREIEESKVTHRHAVQSHRDAAANELERYVAKLRTQF